MMATRPTRNAPQKAKAAPPPRASVPARRQQPAAPARANGGDVPAFMRKKMNTQAGRGTSKDIADNLVPLIYILQPLSPQVMKKNPAYIEGAEAGDLWLKGESNELAIVKGEEGFWFQPVSWWKSWTEWVPRDKGGGFVASYKNENGAPVGMPEDAEKDESGFGYVRPNDNTIILNQSYAGFVYGIGDTPLPYVIILSSSGHTFGRGWMMMINRIILENEQGEMDSAPIYAKKWHLITEHKQNNQGEWFMYKIAGSEFTSEEEWNAGESLASAFESGQKTAAQQETV